MRVGFGGGGGLLTPLFLSIDHQEKKKIICDLVALADSCRAKKDNVHASSPRVFHYNKIYSFLTIIIIIVLIWRHAQY